MSEIIEGEPAVVSKTLAYEAPVADALLTSAVAVYESVTEIVIDSAGAYTAYAQELQEINASIKSIDAFRERLKKPFLEGGRDIDNIFREPLAKRREAAKLVDGALTKYRQAEKARADAEQARLDAIAREAREKAQKEADELAAAGKVEEAQLAAATAAVISAPTVATNVPKVAGVHARKTWVAEVEDKAALLRHIADHPECLDWVEIAAAPLNALARTYKQNLKLPGVVAKEVESTVGR